MVLQLDVPNKGTNNLYFYNVSGRTRLSLASKMPYKVVVIGATIRPKPKYNARTYLRIILINWVR